MRSGERVTSEVRRQMRLWRQRATRGHRLASTTPPQVLQCNFTIRCKKCGENMPAPVGTMPDNWIAAQCPLCGTKRTYLPLDIFRGKLSYRLGPKLARSAVR